MSYGNCPAFSIDCVDRKRQLSAENEMIYEHRIAPLLTQIDCSSTFLELESFPNTQNRKKRKKKEKFLKLLIKFQVHPS